MFYNNNNNSQPLNNTYFVAGAVLSLVDQITHLIFAQVHEVRVFLPSLQTRKQTQKCDGQTYEGSLEVDRPEMNPPSTCQGPPIFLHHSPITWLKVRPICGPGGGRKGLLWHLHASPWASSSCTSLATLVWEAEKGFEQGFPTPYPCRGTLGRKKARMDTKKGHWLGNLV